MRPGDRCVSPVPRQALGHLGRARPEIDNEDVGKRVVAGVAAATCALAALGTVAHQPAAAGAVRPCSNGLVALTFDDGPSTDVTPKLLDLLTERRVPATFFMV